MRTYGTLVLSLLAGACSTITASEIPRIHPASSASRSVRIAVDEVEVSGYWAEEELGPALAGELARAMSASLADAGYLHEHHRPGMDLLTGDGGLREAPANQRTKGRMAIAGPGDSPESGACSDIGRVVPRSEVAPAW